MLTPTLKTRRFTIRVFNERGLLLGDFAVHFMDNQQVEIGFTIAPENQKKHVAKEATSAFLGYLFTTLNKRKVVATTDTRNEASHCLLESLGFRREVHMRKSTFSRGVENAAGRKRRAERGVE